MQTEFPWPLARPSVQAHWSALSRLSGAHIFATGMTGTVGRWVLGVLAQANAELQAEGRALIRMTALTRRNAAEFWRRAPADAQRWLAPWSGQAHDFPLPPGTFTHVLHAACESSQAADADEQGLADAIVGGMLRCLQLARQQPSARVCLLSSAAVYGDAPHPAGYREDDCSAPDSMSGGNAYGLLKRAAEAIGARAQGGFCSARLFAVAGPGVPLAQHFALGNWIGDALAGRRPQLSSDGRAVRSWIALPDAAAWILAILAQGQAGHAYNVGSARHLSLLEAAAAVAAGAGLGAPQVGTAAATRRAVWVPDVDKVKQHCGVAETWRFEDWTRAWLDWEGQVRPQAEVHAILDKDV